MLLWKHNNIFRLLKELNGRWHFKVFRYLCSVIEEMVISSSLSNFTLKKQNLKKNVYLFQFQCLLKLEIYHFVNCPIWNHLLLLSLSHTLCPMIFVFKILFLLQILFWLWNFLWCLLLREDGMLFTGFCSRLPDDDGPASWDVLVILFLTVLWGVIGVVVTANAICQSSLSLIIFLLFRG